MDCNYILTCILDVYKSCHIKSFPFDCIGTIKKYDYTVYSYGELAEQIPEAYEICMQYSSDAFQDYESRLIAYNDLNSKKRTRFSLMHELGHIILRHKASSPSAEQEANYFASNILAPRMAIHYAGCKNEADVAGLFDLSAEAAGYAFESYRRWRRVILARHNKITALDKSMYEHFYDKEEKRFIYVRKKCRDCGGFYTNSSDSRCPSCDRDWTFRYSHMPYYCSSKIKTEE